MIVVPKERPPIPVLLVWTSLGFAEAAALYRGSWSLAFIAAVTFALTLVPMMVTRRLGIRLPVPFLVGATLFIYATIFLGEAHGFYTRFWWWDLVLHGGSALGFSMIGFVFAFILFEGERYSAPPWALAMLGFTIAVTIGAIWEIFEWVMDLSFGTNMQKSGLQDTMTDLVIDVVGGAVGSLSGFIYLRQVGFRGFRQFVGRYVQARLRVRRD
jgi:uncharacterized membrane protein YjdF